MACEPPSPEHETAHNAAGPADGRTVQDRAWKAYLVAGVLTGAVYFLAPVVHGNGLLFNAIGLSTAVAILLGVRRNRPEAALPWYCFAAAQVAFVIGDLVYYTFDFPFPNVGDAFYLAFYPLQVAGLLLLVRRRTPGRDRASLIDAAIITLGLLYFGLYLGALNR